MSQVVDIGQRVAMDSRTMSFLNAIAAIGEAREPIAATLALLQHSEQRFLIAIAVWRLMGSPALPATQGLVHLPVLLGMGFDEIDRVANRLADGGVIEVVATKVDDKGEATQCGFRWPAFDQMLTLGAERAAGPRLTGLDGRPLR